LKNKEYSNIAVLIDAENISYKYLEKLFENIAAYGQISVRRIYSDWTDHKMYAWKPLIHEFSLVTIQQFSNREGKNVSDFALVIDAMDLLHDNIFDCFCIVSSDSDFTRLAQKIREMGKTVIGLGEHKAVKAFVNACNEFIYLNEKTKNDTQINDENESTIETVIEETIEEEKKEKESTIETVIEETIEEEKKEKESTIETVIEETIEEEKKEKENINEEIKNERKRIVIKKEMYETLDTLINKAVYNLQDDEGWVQMLKIIPYIKQIKPYFNLSEYTLNGKPIKRLRNYFEINKKDYELNKDNTIVRKII